MELHSSTTNDDLVGKRSLKRDNYSTLYQAQNTIVGLTSDNKFESYIAFVQTWDCDLLEECCFGR